MYVEHPIAFVDAINWAFVNARFIFYVYTWLSDYVCHGPNSTEITRAYDYQVAGISERDIGKRVTIRLRGDDGFYDLVGELVSATSILNRHGQVVTFNPEQIHIWKEIEQVPRSAKSGAPLSIRIYNLERVLNETWRANIEVESNGWILRADKGITRRANSALVLNDRNQLDLIDLIDQIDEVIGWYRERDLTPTIQLVPDLHKALDEKLSSRGFSDQLDALVMVKDLEPKPRPDFEFHVSEQPSQEWLAAQNDEALAEIMMRSEAKYLSIKEGNQLLAVGRIGFAKDWAVLSRIWVAPNLRGTGLGRKILSALEFESSASKIALQVASSNSVAINLYESEGYVSHHLYRFRALPQKIDLLQDLCC
jgi:ribosomal protein S18 acetylase RimI-like enzyme